MKRLSLLLFALVSFTSPLLAQDFWEQLYFPDSLNITCIAVNQLGDIFVGTNTDDAYDGIFRSQDEGQSWELVLDMGLYGPISLTINDVGDMYALGGIPGWYLLKSIDNGLTWTSLPLPELGGNVKIVSQGTDTLYVSQWADNGAVLLRSINGGSNWETIFTTTGHPGEYISDIAFSSTGVIYVSLMCFFQDMGGVYKSIDNGMTWEYVGLVNNQVKDIEVNSTDDLFIGVYSDFEFGGGGIYSQYHDSPEIIECIYGPNINGLVINSDNDIYAGCGMPNGIIRSFDNGLNFDFINDGLPIGPMGKLEIDHQNYIYVLSDALSHYLFRSKESTVTSILSPILAINSQRIIIMPNPINDYLNLFVPVDFQSETKFLLQIFDVTGKVVMSKIIYTNNSIFEIHILLLKAGFYVLTISNNQNIYTTNFIKQ